VVGGGFVGRGFDGLDCGAVASTGDVTATGLAEPDGVVTVVSVGGGVAIGGLADPVGVTTVD
jgi:hypothetical protein